MPALLNSGGGWQKGEGLSLSLSLSLSPFPPNSPAEEAVEKVEQIFLPLTPHPLLPITPQVDECEMNTLQHFLQRLHLGVIDRQTDRQ